MRRWMWLVVLALVTPLLASELPALAAPKKAPEKKEKEAIGQITFKVLPEDIVIFVDDKKIGPAGKAPPLKVKAGQHVVRLVKGSDAIEATVDVPPNINIPFEYTWEESEPLPTP